MPRRRMHYFHGTAGHPPFPRVQGPNHAGLFLGTGDFRAALAAGNRPPERCIGGPTGPGRAIPREVAHPHGTRRVSESARTACNGGAGPRRVVLGAGRRGPGRPRRALPRSRPAGPRRRSRAALGPARRRRPGAEVLDATEGPVPPVGHSCDGAVITEAGDHPVVAHLVFLCALTLDRDGSCTSAAAGDLATARIDYDDRPDFGAGVLVDDRGITTLHTVATCLYGRGDADAVAGGARPAGAAATRRAPAGRDGGGVAFAAIHLRRLHGGPGRPSGPPTGPRPSHHTVEWRSDHPPSSHRPSGSSTCSRGWHARTIVSPGPKGDAAGTPRPGGAIGSRPQPHRVPRGLAHRRTTVPGGERRRWDRFLPRRPPRSGAGSLSSQVTTRGTKARAKLVWPSACRV